MVIITYPTLEKHCAGCANSVQSAFSFHGTSKNITSFFHNFESKPYNYHTHIFFATYSLLFALFASTLFGAYSIHHFYKFVKVCSTSVCKTIIPNLLQNCFLLCSIFSTGHPISCIQQTSPTHRVKDVCFSILFLHPRTGHFTAFSSYRASG